jgi:hypothetical protein
VLDPPIVIKNKSDRYQETPFNIAAAAAVLLDHVFPCGEYRTTQSVASTGIRRSICTDQRPHWLSQSRVL